MLRILRLVRLVKLVRLFKLQSVSFTCNYKYVYFARPCEQEFRLFHNLAKNRRQSEHAQVRMPWSYLERFPILHMSCTGLRATSTPVCPHFPRDRTNRQSFMKLKLPTLSGSIHRDLILATGYLCSAAIYYVLTRTFLVVSVSTSNDLCHLMCRSHRMHWTRRTCRALIHVSGA